jgi:SAM-dependent methyltransferase
MAPSAAAEGSADVASLAQDRRDDEPAGHDVAVELMGPPTPLLVETASKLKPGRALDLACGTGRNAIWLAEHGWQVTAVDRSPITIPTVDMHVADLEKHEFTIKEASFDLIAVCYYLQRDLFEAVKCGVKPGGVALVIVHLVEPGHEQSRFSLQPGELAKYFEGWEILHSYEGKPRDPEHKRVVAEIVARTSAT